MIPTYHQSEYLRYAILSVLSQTAKPSVIVISVEDDQPTNSYMDEIYGVDESILWRKVKNPSVFGQLNTAVRGALELGFDYMMFMGSDDFLLPNKIRQEVGLAYKYSAKLVYSPFFTSDKYLNVLRCIQLPNPVKWDTLVKQSYVPDMALVHRSVFEEFDVFDEAQGDQVAIYDKWLHIAEKYESLMIYSPWPNYIYRKHPKQTSEMVPLRMEDRERVQKQSIERHNG